MDCKNCHKTLNGTVALAVPHGKPPFRSVSYFCHEACRVAFLTNYRQDCIRFDGDKSPWLRKPVKPLTAKQVSEYTRQMPPYIPRDQLKEFNSAVRAVEEISGMKVTFPALNGKWAYNKNGETNRGRYFWTYRRANTEICDYIPLTYAEALQRYGDNLLNRLDWSQR